MIRKNILKQNIKRYSAGYIFALSLFSLVGVGFSSWITSENNSKAIDINLLADGSYQFFKLNSVENIDEYRLSKYGFIDSSDKILSSVNYNFNFTFLIKDAKEYGYVSDSGDVNFLFTVNDSSSTCFATFINNQFFTSDVNLYKDSSLLANQTVSRKDSSTCSANIAVNFTESDSVDLKLTLNLLLNSNKTTEITNYINSLSSSILSISFLMNFEVTK